MQLPPIVMGGLYRPRWQIELNFKWIKRHLHTTASFRTSENPMKMQVSPAVATYVPITDVKKRAMLPHSLY